MARLTNILAAAALIAGVASAAEPMLPGVDVVSFQGVMIPHGDISNYSAVSSVTGLAPGLTDEVELTLSEAGVAIDDYTQLNLANPANAIDWTWAVSSGTGNMFLQSPLAFDGISFVESGTDIITTVDRLHTLDDLTVGSSTSSGELEVMDLTVGGMGTSLCIDAAGESKLGRCSSSIRYKEAVRDLSLGLDTVLDLRPVGFRWKTDQAEDLGFIAEEVAAVDPLLVTYEETGTESGVKYRRLTALLVRAIQDLSRKVDELDDGTGKLVNAKALQRDNMKLRDQLDELRAELDTSRQALLILQQDVGMLVKTVSQLKTVDSEVDPNIVVMVTQ